MDELAIRNGFVVDGTGTPGRHADVFVDETATHGTHGCNYLLTTDMEMQPVPGYRFANWQRGYGVVSFGKNNLTWVLDYIADQKEHHARGTIYDRLERTECDKEGPQMSEDVSRSPAEAG